MTTTRPVRYSARWVLPATSAPIERGAVLVIDGRIAAVGPAASVPLPDGGEDLHLGEAVLLPGLVNVHAHPELSLLRGALEDLPFHLWIPRLRQLKAAAVLSPDDLRDAARWTLAECAAAGVTTVGATEDSDASLHALRDAGMRGIVYREVFSPAPADATSALQGLRDNVSAMRTLETELVRVGVSPHAPYSVSDALFTAVARFAHEQSLPVAVHTAESATEQELVTSGDGFFANALRARGIETVARGASTIDMLQRTGILDLAPLLIHCVRVSADDIAMIVSAGASVAHCPVANARLGHGIAPITELMTAGAVVGIGTDSVASNNRIDMLEEARVAQLMQRARLGSPDVLPTHALLRLVTIDGARALGLDDVTGSLEIGKDADLCAVALDGIHSVPIFDPVGTLFMSASASDVVLTAVRGRVIYRRGVESTLATATLATRMDVLGTRVRVAAASET
ncbi:MAG: amidohydrolase family protein [Longimicrobiales bacterium]